MIEANRAWINKNQTYWDAMANCGQLHGNVGRITALAIIYRFLEGN